MEEKEIMLNAKDPNCMYDLETSKKRLIFWLDELKGLTVDMYEEEKDYLKVCKDNIDYFYYLFSNGIMKEKLMVCGQ